MCRKISFLNFTTIEIILKKQNKLQQTQLKSQNNDRIFNKK